MPNENQPGHITLSIEEAEALKARVNASAGVLSEHDIKLLVGLISFNLWLQKQLSLAKLSIRRLKRLFGFSTEKKTPK